MSCSTVNVLWGFFNLGVAYLLVCRVGSFNLRKTRHALVLGAGILIMSLMQARTFGTPPRRPVIVPSLLPRPNAGHRVLSPQ
ncbi:MAG: hypothetical protein WBV46_10965 [Terriglobales bacterium]